MEPQDNKKLALQKAISAHEQAAAALTDLQQGEAEHRYAAMLARINQNITELRADSAGTDSADLV